MARKTKIKNCVVLNLPTTLQEQEEYDRTVARALAQAIYRSFSPLEFENIVKSLNASIKTERQTAS